jgi:hypothetical protein
MAGVSLIGKSAGLLSYELITIINTVTVKLR